MTRGTTPTHTFTLQIDTALIKRLSITYEQGQTQVKKTEADCEMSGKTVTLRLTQEDTLKFTHDCPVRIQLRVLTTSGDALASGIKTMRVEDVLDDEVMA